MKLYKMSGGGMKVRRGVCLGCMKGGYSPLLLQVNHGAGMKLTSESPVDMSRAKNLLNGLSVGSGKRKKYVSI